MEIYIVARSSEDGYINIDSCHREYGEADARAEELIAEDDCEWEVIPSEID
jgi:hypothetical protein